MEDTQTISFVLKINVRLGFHFKYCFKDVCANLVPSLAINKACTLYDMKKSTSKSNNNIKFHVTDTYYIRLYQFRVSMFILKIFSNVTYNHLSLFRQK